MKTLPVFLFCAMTLSPAELRLGLVGTDTSHVIAFAKLLNDNSAADRVPGARIVAAYKGGSPDNALSAKYVDQYAEELRTKWGVEIVPDLPSVRAKMDAALRSQQGGGKPATLR